MTAGLLLAAAAASAVGTCIAVLSLPARVQPVMAGIGTAAVGGCGAAAGVATIATGFRPVLLSWALPLSGARFDGDGLSGLLLLVTGGVAVAAGIYTVGYARQMPAPRATLAALPIFVASMLAVVTAGSVTTFLFGWEVMALTSLMLVLADHRHQSTREAGAMYAVMTHLSFAAALVGLAIFAAGAHTETFSGLAAAAGGLPRSTRTVVFVATMFGFGSKAGLFPLHAWLPRAHAEAPSFASALMSAAMVNIGIYGLIRVDVVLLGPGPGWWGLILLAAGALTAVYAVVQASVATDLKRLLAYSTSENMGLIMLAVGAGMLLRAAGNPTVADVAFAAALLHLVAHASFKTLAFLSAGAVVSATGIRDLDSLGGLARRMPVTTVLFAIAALGATGLPLGAGFVSEWLLVQSLIHTLPAGGVELPLVMPLAVGAVALTTGVGVAAMVKAFGVGFLARARSDAAEAAAEVNAAMRVAMVLPALACTALAFAPVLVTPALRAALRTLAAGHPAATPSLGVLLRLPGIHGTISPVLIATCVATGLVMVAVFSRGSARLRPAPRAVPLWSCGGGPLSPRMQYTATSFAEPLQRVFRDVILPDADVTVTHLAESRYLIDQVSYTSRVVDAVETRLYRPIVAAVTAAASLMRRAHTGSVHVYLGYGTAALLVLLVVAG